MIDSFIQSVKDLWNSNNAFPKIVAALIILGLFMLLVTFLPVLLGIIAVVVVGVCLYQVFLKK